MGMQSGQHLPQAVQKLAAHEAEHVTGSTKEMIASNLKPWNVGGSSARICAVKLAAERSELSSDTTAKVLLALGRSELFHWGYVEMNRSSGLLLSTICGTWRYAGSFSSPGQAPVPRGAGTHSSPE